MPLYDLECIQCGLITRDVFLAGDVVLHICKCGAVNKFRKLPSRVAVHFKGKGWSKKGLKND